MNKRMVRKQSPSEKFMQKCCSALSDKELLSISSLRGFKHRTVLDTLFK